MRIQAAHRKQPIDLYIDCVVLSSFRSEFTFLQNVYRLTGIRMRHAESLDEADFLLTVTESTVLLADIVFADGSWQSALSLLRERHPLVTMLVVADPVDSPFLRDLYDRGACGVIWKPFDFDAVRMLIRAVHEASKERRALREEIACGNGQSGEQPSGAPVGDARSPRLLRTEA
jgi:DNA-binding NtrC family response regulator